MAPPLVEAAAPIAAALAMWGVVLAFGARFLRKPVKQRPAGGAPKGGKATKKDKGKVGKARGVCDAPPQQHHQAAVVAVPPAPAPVQRKATGHSAPAAPAGHSASGHPAVGSAAGGMTGASPVPRAAAQAPVSAPRSPQKNASVRPTHRSGGSLNSTESDTEEEEEAAGTGQRPAAVPQGAVAAVPSGVVGAEHDDTWQVCLGPCVFGATGRAYGWRRAGRASRRGVFRACGPRAGTDWPGSARDTRWARPCCALHSGSYAAPTD